MLLALSVLLLLLSPAAAAEGKRRQRQPFLTTTYYSKSCPKFEQIVQDTTTNKQISTPTTAAAALRLFFHDRLVSGRDASVIVSSTHFSKADRDADINLSLPCPRRRLLRRHPHLHGSTDTWPAPIAHCFCGSERIYDGEGGTYI